MRRRVFSGYVAFTLTPAERARLTLVAQRCGYAHLDPLAADLFRIGLSHLDTTFVTTTSHERFIGARARMAKMNALEKTRGGRRASRAADRRLA
jgi:hypothetical protein